MNTKLIGLALACLAGLSAGSASAGVVVTYSHPENFQDMPFAQSDRERVLKELTEHFARLGKRLPADQELRVEVLDFDMAGRILPRASGQQDIRIVKDGADWPTMLVRYQLLSNGQVLSSGEDRLKDMNYIYTDRINRYGDGDLLRYEKRMIDDWFKKFVPAKSG